MDGGAVEQRAVLDDGQAQARAAGLPGMALVHPVEPLEDALDLVFRDPIPVSVTMTFAPLSVFPTQTVTLPPGRLYLMAFSQML